MDLRVTADRGDGVTVKYMNDPNNLTVAIVFAGFALAILIMYWWLGKRRKDGK